MGRTPGSDVVPFTDGPAFLEPHLYKATLAYGPTAASPGREAGTS